MWHVREEMESTKRAQASEHCLHSGIGSIRRSREIVHFLCAGVQKDPRGVI